MVSGYRMSHLDAADYRTWRRYNKTPYRSATHGERFVNNSGNIAAKAYRNYENAGDMPTGAILANDHLFFVPDDYRVKILSIQPDG